jgi:hypothetical protein
VHPNHIKVAIAGAPSIGDANYQIAIPDHDGTQVPKGGFVPGMSMFPGKAFGMSCPPVASCGVVLRWRIITCLDPKTQDDPSKLPFSMTVADSSMLRPKDNEVSDKIQSPLFEGKHKDPAVNFLREDSAGDRQQLIPSWSILGGRAVGLQVLAWSNVASQMPVSPGSAYYSAISSATIWRV